MRNKTFLPLNIPTCLALIGAVFQQPTTLSAQNGAEVAAAGAVVTVYQDPNFKGAKRECNTGDYRQNDLPALNNDAASSIKVTPGYEVTIYENDNFGGTSLVIDGDVAQLAEYEFNDKLSSMKVRKIVKPTIAKLYRNKNFKGLYTSVKEDNKGINQSELGAVGNDAMSSIWLDPKFEAILFQDKDYAGNDRREPVSNQSIDPRWEDKVSSVLIRNKVTGAAPTELKFDYKQKVALLMQGHGYLKYEVRDKGINLDWSQTPVYEWEVQGEGNPSGKVKTGKLFRLYNHVEKDYLVYAVRDNGIHLRWLKDSSKKDAFDWTFDAENLPNTRSSVFLKNRTLAADGKPCYIRYGPRAEGINLIFEGKTTFGPFMVEKQ